MATLNPALERAFRRSLDTGLAAATHWPGEGLVVALSGGSDSVALLHLAAERAREAGWALVAAHLDHGLRGDEARDDLEFCRRLASELDVPFVHEAVDVRAHADEGRLSLEDAARRLRREFLKRVAERAGARAVLLGHTQDDQAETVLLNLMRGAGPRGLGAMPAAGPRPFLRPLLGLERSALREWLLAREFAWREDASNDDTVFTRNRVRHELMPILKEKFNPQAVKALVRTASLQHEIDQLLKRLSAGHLEAHARVDVEGGRVVLDRAALLAEPPAVIRAVLRAAGERIAPERLSWGQVHLEGVMGGLIQRGEARWVFPSGMILVKSGDELVLERPRPTGQPEPSGPEPVEVPLVPGTEVAWGEGCLRISRVELDGGRGASGLRLDPGPRAALFNADGLPPRLLLRAVRTGERMSLFGGGRHRKVSDILIDARVPLGARRGVPVLAEPLPAGDGPADEALWVVGVARSAAATITEATHRVLLAEWFGPLPGAARKALNGN
jgi:tRNA(Ile)-lysidine synthase